MLLTVLHWAAFKCSSREIQRWMRCVTAFKDLLGLNQLSRRKLKGLKTVTSLGAIYISQNHYKMESQVYTSPFSWRPVGRLLGPGTLDFLWAVGQTGTQTCADYSSHDFQLTPIGVFAQLCYLSSVCPPLSLSNSWTPCMMSKRQAKSGPRNCKENAHYAVRNTQLKWLVMCFCIWKDIICEWFAYVEI